MAVLDLTVRLVVVWAMVFGTLPYRILYAVGLTLLLSMTAYDLHRKQRAFEQMEESINKYYERRRRGEMH